MDRLVLEANGLGRVRISTRAVAELVGLVAAECYGVIGMAVRGGAVGRLLARGPAQGIEVRPTHAGLVVTLHVVVADGLKLAEVASAVRNRVSYEVERLTGLRVAAVEVHVADVRSSP